jgi:hypothetical protein
MDVNFGKLKKRFIKILALEMDFWHKSARTSRSEKVRNEIVREIQI